MIFALPIIGLPRPSCKGTLAQALELAGRRQGSQVKKLLPEVVPVGVISPDWRDSSW
jgi:hypothetical protein